MLLDHETLDKGRDCNRGIDLHSFTVGIGIATQIVLATQRIFGVEAWKEEDKENGGVKDPDIARE